MLKPLTAFCLSLATGSALAQSLPAPLNTLPISNLTSALGSPGLPAGGLPAGLPSGLPGGVPSGLPSGLPSGAGGLSSGGLPGLAALPSAGGAIPLGVTALQPGTNGTGPAYVLNLGTGGAPNNTIIGNIVAPVVTPLVGAPSGSGPLAVGVGNGDGVSNTAPGGLASVAAVSGSNNGNGGLVGVGVINDNNTGSGQYLGVGVLSGQNAGTSSQGLGVSVLNQGNPLGVTAGGQSASLATLQNATGQAPGFDQNGIAIGGGPNSTASSSNPLLNAGVLAGQNAGSGGGALGVAVLSGNNSANNAQVAGVAVLSGNGSGNGSPVSASLIGGNNSGNGSVVGAGVINGNNTGNGGTLGAGVLNGNGSGNGGQIGAGVINGNQSGNGGSVGAGALNGANSGNGGALGAGLINGAGNNGSGTGPGVIRPDGTQLDPARSDVLASALDKQCSVITKDAKGRVVKADKASCEPRSHAVAGQQLKK